MDYMPFVGERFRSGRNISEGYQRGCGLEFGNLGDKISVDPDYVDAIEYCGARSVVRGDRLMNLFFL